MAGVRPAHRNRCEHRRWGREGSSEGAAATSEMTRRHWWHSAAVHPFTKDGSPKGERPTDALVDVHINLRTDPNMEEAL